MPTLSTGIIGIRGDDREVAKFKLDMADGDHPFSMEKLARRTAIALGGSRATVRDIMLKQHSCEWIEYATKGTAVVLQSSQRLPSSAFGAIADMAGRSDLHDDGIGYALDLNSVDMAANLRFAAHHPELVSFPDKVEWETVSLMDREWETVRFYSPSGNPTLGKLTDMFPDLDIFLLSVTGRLRDNLPTFCAEFPTDRGEGLPHGQAFLRPNGEVAENLEKGSLSEADWEEIASLLWSPEHQIY